MKETEAADPVGRLVDAIFKQWQRQVAPSDTRVEGS